MNKIPKTIYIDEESDEPIWFTSAEECAVSGEARTLGVYKLIGKVEVTTQIKQEIVVKKQSRKQTAPAAAPVLETTPETPEPTDFLPNQISETDNLFITP